MEVKDFKISGWTDALNAARNTVGKEPLGKEPSDIWKKKMLLAEHSPIRLVKLDWKWVDLKYWVSVHLVRHKHGIEHFVSTQRVDRTNVDRDSKRQDSLVTHQVNCNAQSIINISRKRLCMQASIETRKAWRAVIQEIEKHDPVLASVCVPECVFRGFCPEENTCGFAYSSGFKDMVFNYREI